MTKLESDIEELWDWICARLGFNKDGTELQNAIRDFVRLKIRELTEEKKWGNMYRIVPYEEAEEVFNTIRKGYPCEY